MAWNKDTSLIGTIMKFIFLTFPLSIPITHPYILLPTHVVAYQSDNIGNWKTGFIFNWFLYFENCLKTKELKEYKDMDTKNLVPYFPISTKNLMNFFPIWKQNLEFRYPLL